MTFALTLRYFAEMSNTEHVTTNDCTKA